MTWNTIRWPSYAVLLGLSVGFAYGSKLLNTLFLPGLEHRPGIAVYDPVLEWLPAMDVSGPIFWVMYPTLFAGYALAARNPKLLVVAFSAHGFMYLFRFFCILCVPLHAPADLVVLRDPVVDFMGFHTVFLRRDLFYSGHFASVFLFFILAGKAWYRWLFLLCALVVGVLILVQHIHYSYDILGAVAFSYLSVYCATLVTERGFRRLGCGQNT